MSNLQPQQEVEMIEYRFQYPKIANCGECPLMYDYIYCGADVDNTASLKHSEKIDGNDYFFTMSDDDKRPNWCPLKEVI